MTRTPMSSRPPSIVIADWLKSTPVGQYTPFEAAMSLMNYLQDEGYYVMRPEYPPSSQPGGDRP